MYLLRLHGNSPSHHNSEKSYDLVVLSAKYRQCTVFVMNSSNSSKDSTLPFFFASNISALYGKKWRCTIFAVAPLLGGLITQRLYTAFFLSPTIQLARKRAYDTRASQAVPHPSTVLARRCLTSVIERERVLHRGMTVHSIEWL